MICGIYKISSPKGRIYIGQSVNINYRWYQHRHNTNQEYALLYRSFKKYGVENHLFTLIEECAKEYLDN